MARHSIFSLLCAIFIVGVADAFTGKRISSYIRQVSHIYLTLPSYQFEIVPVTKSSVSFVNSRTTGSSLFMSDDENDVQRAPLSTRIPTMERGVSVDQDGKSNVWAIEPKMEVDTKSSEEKTSAALIAVGGLAAFAVAAAFILTNLPDPDQF